MAHGEAHLSLSGLLHMTSQLAGGRANETMSRVLVTHTRPLVQSLVAMLGKVGSNEMHNAVPLFPRRCALL